MRRIRITAAAAAFAVTVVGAAASVGAAPGRLLGDSKVVAQVGAPGFPEGIVVTGNRMYVATPAQNGQKGPAHVFAYDATTGALVRDYVIPAKDPIADHGLVGLALDGSNHLYVADIQWGVVQVDLASGQTVQYASLADLPPCLPVPLGPCSPTVADRAPFPNDLVFDGFGNMYVSDSFQATIWRVPKGGGPAQIWFQDAVLDGTVLGANGVRLSPDGSELCVSVFGPPGSLHCIGVSDAPQASDRRLVRSYPTEGPDNMAFGQSGKLYMALAGSNQVAVLDHKSGTELQRFSGPAAGPNGSTTAWDAPAGVAFHDGSRSLRVTNHALITGLVNPALFVVFDVYVNDTGLPLWRPLIASAL